LKKIICFRNSKLGDYIVSIPALELIRKKNPNCKIFYLLAQNRFSPDLPKEIENNKIVDEFIYFKHNFIGQLKLIKHLRKKKFDKFYYLQEKPNLYREIRDFLFFKLLGIDKMYGFFEKKLNHRNYNESFQIAKRVDKNINKNDLDKLTQLKNNITKPIYNFKYISLSIGGFSQPKIWKVENWNILSSLLIKKFRYKIIILGTKKDIKNARIISRKNKFFFLSLCGKTNIKQLLNIIKFSDIHITNDNGSMHVASIFSKKTICIFNNHDPIGKWYPTNKNAIIIRSKNGVDNINPYKVYRKFLKLLNFSN